VGRLYDAVAVGMLAYSRAAFRVRVLAPRRFALEPGTLLVVTHRRETDVPVVCPPLYFGAEQWRRPERRMWFAARDDLFLDGFFAGFPPDLSPRLRRLLYPVGIGRFLPRVNVYPIRSASVARLGELVRARPEARLDELLPAALVEELRARADRARLARPALAGGVDRGEYADLLWRSVTAEETVGTELETFWGARAVQATADFRTFVDLLRSRRTLVVFPEGRPSPSGDIGPLQRGLSSLVRRGRPVALRPVALAYDPLTSGRTRVFLSIGEPVAPEERDAEAQALALLRRGMPLTCGQVVARLARAGCGASEDDVTEAVEAARAERRPFDPELAGGESLRRRLADALAAVPGREREMAFLAREYESAREG
jgi:1-acyl-sn-glycerol-3-phosphate acyltransferase